MTSLEHPIVDIAAARALGDAFRRVDYSEDGVTRLLDRALDVGTGSGVQALLAARHAREVVATDVNPRALAYAELNAALNGFTNLECRAGSMFEPVAGETFDLITCNAPFVVSPEN